MKHLAAMLLFVLIGCNAAAQQADETTPPNIVFIMIDDLGYTDLGCTGSDFYRTPNINAFAEQSMTFNAAYANCANCAPTRAALMSGMYAPRTGVYTVGNPDRGRANDRVLIPTPNNTELAPEFVTIAEVLREAGFATASIGKWHLGSGDTGPTNQGFDINIAGTNGGGTRSFFSPYPIDNIEDGPEGEYLTDRLTREAADYIAEQSQTDRPFFLYLPLYSVHTPIQPQQQFVDRQQGRVPGEVHDHVQYAAFVEGMDHYVGRVLDAIDQAGVADNTIVIFTSDNGGHGTFTDQHPLRGGKGMFYEGGIRVPLFVRYPGVTTAGSTSDEPVVLLDFYPTLAHAAGVLDQAVHADGRSLLPLMRDADAELEREAIFFHFPAYLQGYAGGEGAEAHRPPWRATPCSAVRSGDWKLILYFETNEVELFNLAEDPGEQHDLTGANPAKAAELLTLLRVWQQETDAPIPTERNPQYRGE